MLRTSLLAVLVFLCTSSLALAEIYKCKNASGDITFSGRPCVGGMVQGSLSSKKTKTRDWLKSLRQKKSIAVDIVDVKRKADDVYIDIETFSFVESNEFMRLAHKVSGMGVTMLKMNPPKGGELLKATLLVSSKPNKLADFIKSRSVKTKLTPIN